MNWTRVTDPDTAVTLLPTWFASRMMATRGCYGFLLSTGDVVRVSRITAAHVSSSGQILVDVLLDHAGVPGGVDAAWQPKQFLGAPVPGANLATLNLAQVAMVVEFVAAEIVETESINRIPTAVSVSADKPVVAGPLVRREIEPIS